MHPVERSLGQGAHHVPERIQENHRVKDITSGVMDVANQGKKGLDHVKNVLATASDTEKGLYGIAAVVMMIVMILFSILFFSGGFAALLPAIAPIASAAGFSSGLTYWARSHTGQRTPWLMPPYSEAVEKDPKAQETWGHLWHLRNKAKLAHQDKRNEIRAKVIAKADTVDLEKEAEKLLQAYEQAEVNFWGFADPQVAQEKIQEFEEARHKRKIS